MDPTEIYLNVLDILLFILLLSLLFNVSNINHLEEKWLDLPGSWEFSGYSPLAGDGGCLEIGDTPQIPPIYWKKKKNTLCFGLPKFETYPIWVIITTNLSGMCQYRVSLVDSRKPLPLRDRNSFRLQHQTYEVSNSLGWWWIPQQWAYQLAKPWGLPGLPGLNLAKPPSPGEGVPPQRWPRLKLPEKQLAGIRFLGNWIEENMVIGTPNKMGCQKTGDKYQASWGWYSVANNGGWYPTNTTWAWGFLHISLAEKLGRSPNHNVASSTSWWCNIQHLKWWWSLLSLVLSREWSMITIDISW